MEEDMADIDSRRDEVVAAKLAAELKRRSQALQRELPRPFHVNPKARRDVDSKDLKAASDMLNDEIVAMLRFDSQKYPLGGGVSRSMNRFRFTDDQLAEV